MKKLLLLHFLVLFALYHSAQTSYNTFWIQFKDKHNSEFSISKPNQFLSKKAIERRLEWGLGFDSLDLPVNKNYIDQVLNMGNSQLLLKSKWFNSITVQVNDTSSSVLATWLNQISQLECVLQVRSLENILQNGKVISIQGEQANQENQTHSYGDSYRQIEMLNGHFLHDLGFEGQGVDLAVFDGGFLFADELPAMKHLFSEGRIISQHDLLHFNSSEVFDASTHGMMVLSHMAGIIPDSLYGTATQSNYFLFQTEDVFQEVRLEEDTWIQAAEMADSIGVDLINSSLGYSLFDFESMSYLPVDMNGQTTRISQAANICALKGTLVVNSAGNSGASAWHAITAPSDAEHVLSIGAVDENEIHASFSGYRPPNGPFVKPNVVAMGKQTVYAAYDSTIARGNGTSFSSPIIAGLAACLMQAFPHVSNLKIKDVIERSASLYETPNDSMGFGVPDFWKAFLMLSQEQNGFVQNENILVYPQPSSGIFEVRIKSNMVTPKVYLFSATGSSIRNTRPYFNQLENEWCRIEVDLSNQAAGTYYLMVHENDEILTTPLIRIE
jgi:serine protease AprX